MKVTIAANQEDAFKKKIEKFYGLTKDFNKDHQTCPVKDVSTYCG